MNRITQKYSSLVPSTHHSSDDASQSNGVLIGRLRPATYGSFQEDADVESAEVLSTAILVGDDSQFEHFGIVLMLLSAAGFSLNGLTVKMSGQYFSASLIVLARSIIQALFGFIACWYLDIAPLGPSHKRRLLILRGMFGAIGLALYYYALTSIPIADATVLFFTGPVFTSILAHLWLGEPFTLFDALASLVCFTGVILTARPPFIFGMSHSPHLPTLSSSQTKGAITAIMGAGFSACAYVTVRRIGLEVHFLHHVLSFGIASTFFSGLMVKVDPGCSKESLFEALGFNIPTLLLILVGITAIVGQCLLNRGLQLCRAGPATLMRNVDVVFAYLYGILIFNEIPSYYSVFGSFLIVSCTLSMGIRKWIT